MSIPNPFAQQPTKEQQDAAARFMESCAVKTAISGVGGFGLGALFGLMFSSIDFSSPVNTAAVEASTKTETVKTVLKDMGRKSYSSAKGFAVVAAVYTGCECAIES
ncbi:Mitochondrial import inner membrane translocase subunit tim22, partial [Spiromyces aspiralis]